MPASPSQGPPVDERSVQDRAVDGRSIDRGGTRPATAAAPDPRSADLLGGLGTADVRSVAPSGREVYDPGSRSAVRPEYGTGTRSTDAGGGGSVPIEVPLLGHLEHAAAGGPAQGAATPRTGRRIHIEPDPLRAVKALPVQEKVVRAQRLAESVMQDMDQLAVQFDQEIEEYEEPFVNIIRGSRITKGEKTGEDRVVVGQPYLTALKGFAETVRAIIHPDRYAWEICHPTVVDPSIPFYLEPPPELPVQPGKPNPNGLKYEGAGYTRGFEKAIEAAERHGFDVPGENRWLLQQIGYRHFLEDRMLALINQRARQWIERTLRQKAAGDQGSAPPSFRSIGWPGWPAPACT